MIGRWADYFIKRGEEFRDFWQKYLNSQKRDLLFILGQGFDPRMCDAVSAIMNTDGSGRRDCILLDLDEGPDSPSKDYQSFVDDNLKTLKALIEKDGQGKIMIRTIKMWTDDKRRVASMNAALIFKSIDEFSSYTDIVVDISAIPRCVYFPLIHKIMFLFDEKKKAGGKNVIPNLHIVVSEDYFLDGHIIGKGIEDNANYFHGFGAIDREANKEMPKVWIPLLGEGKGEHLVKIRDFIKPDEVCPLLPFPSKNPRRGDELIQEHRRFLFDDLIIEPYNIIYADERNPFQVYRKIRMTIDHYCRTMEVLGGCKVVISVLSSKLLSMGALLAAYESKSESKLIGVAHVESHGYSIDGDLQNLLKQRNSELFELWLMGDCYV